MPVPLELEAHANVAQAVEGVHALGTAVSEAGAGIATHGGESEGHFDAMKEKLTQLSEVGGAALVHISGALEHLGSVGAPIGGQLAGVVTSIGKMGEGIPVIGGLVGGASDLAATLLKMGDEAAANVGKFQKLSTIMGVSATDAAQWTYVAQQSGVGADAWTAAMGKLEKKMETAGQGDAKFNSVVSASQTQLQGLRDELEKHPEQHVKIQAAIDKSQAALDKIIAGGPKAQSVFGQLGIEVQGADGKLKSLNEVLPELADKFKDMPNGPEKTALAMQLFGAKGKDLLPFLNKGAAGLEELKHQAEALGIEVNANTIDATNKLRTAQRQLAGAGEALGQTIGENVIPLLAVVATTMASGIPIVMGLARAVGETLAPVFSFLGGLLQGGIAIGVQVASAAFTGLMSIVNAIAPYVQNLVSIVGAVVTAFTGGGFDAAGAALTTFGTSIGANLGAIGTTIITQLGAWASAFLDWIGPMIGPFLGQLASWYFAFEGWLLGTALPAAITALGNLASAFVAWIGPLIPPFLAQLGLWAAAAWDWLTGTAIPVAITTLGNLATAFVAWIGPMIPPFIAQLGQWAAQLGSWLMGTALPAVVSKLGEWAGAFVAWIGPMIPPFLAKMGELATQLGGWLLNTALPAIVTQLGQWAGAFVAWVGPMIPPLLQKTGELLVALGGWLLNTALPLLITNLGQWGGAFLGFMAKDVLPFIGAKLGEFATALWGWVTGLASDAVGKLAAVGASIIQGILNGLAAGKDAIINFIIGLAGGAIDAVKKALGISSPSAVMHELFTQVGAGMLTGLQASTPAVLDHLQNLMGTARGIMSQPLPLPALGGGVSGGFVGGATGVGGAVGRGGGGSQVINITMVQDQYGNWQMDRLAEALQVNIINRTGAAI